MRRGGRRPAVSLHAWLPVRPPKWLEAFAAKGAPELEKLLLDQVYLGSLNAVDPDELLLDWADALGPEFNADLDRALSEVVAARWWDRDDDLTPADLTWHRLMRVAASLDEAPVTRELLWNLRASAPQRLGPLVRHGARDALGWFWAAVSTNQVDDSLVSRWFDICRLTNGTPSFHGRWGLLGLRRAPNSQAGGFREAFALGLKLYISALVGRVDRGEIEASQANRLALTEINLARRVYPFPALWRNFWSQNIRELGDQERRWIQSGFGERVLIPTRGRNGLTTITYTPARIRYWTDKSRILAGKLRTAEEADLAEVDKLLAEQREFYYATGEREYLVKTLCNMSNSIKDHDPAVAVAWAHEAWKISPDNYYTWGAYTTALRRADQTETAVSLGFAAYDRFPDNAYIASELGQSLRLASRYVEAVHIFNRARALEKDSFHVLSSLGVCYNELGEFPRAAEIFEQVLAALPDDVFAGNGLADAYLKMGDERAELVYTAVHKAHPDDSYSRNWIAELAQRRGDTETAEALFKRSLRDDKRDIFALNGMGNIEFNRGNIAEAKRFFQRSKHANSDNDIATKGLQKVQEFEKASCGQSDAASPDEHLASENNAHSINAPDGTGEPSGQLPNSSSVGPPARAKQPDSEAILPDAPAKNRFTIADGSHVNDIGAFAELEGKALALRGAAANLRALPAIERGAAAEIVLGKAESMLSVSPHQPDALFTKTEILALLGRIEQAASTLSDLPDYLAERPEFLALQGTLAFERIQTIDSEFQPQKLATVTAPLEQAGHRQRALQWMPYVGALRASSAMIDGQALDDQRIASAQNLKDALARSSSRDDLGQWYQTSIANILDGMEDLAPAELAAFVESKSDELDDLDSALTSAARYRYAPA